MEIIIRLLLAIVISMFMVVVFCEGVLRAIKWRDEDKEIKSYNSLYNWKKSRNI